MKEKLKLLILQIEGWEQSQIWAGYLRHKKHIDPDTKLWNAFSHKAAWDEQFGKFTDILQTKLFWLFFSAILGALFMLFSDNSTVIKNGIHWFNYAGAVCFLFPVGWTLYGIGYMLYHAVKKWKGRKK
jgi:hypothetical protein